ncbi:DNA-binding domain-containing protein [Aerococcus kribbianus]|uniref:Response regulator n=1 Tax=Aerococcus kribbianus TaxID=2999064 RepID=A0A9X3FP27_9LACT|nr:MULTISPECIES: response regulator [unclassified Aerococcus]MCZ0717323.1 response regulator [Aerococcus sp. YH-aer221]MCZ0725611.1 response regulator [Aerococcus sp. YH-aer222]
MRFYIIDDDYSIVNILTNLVEQDANDTVVGQSTVPEQALKDLVGLSVDIILIDLLMPVINGIELVHKIRQFHPHIKFIMISQVTDGDLREEAYLEGIEFFINKPLNIIEVQTIIKRVKHGIQMEAQLNTIQDILGTGPQQTQKNSKDYDTRERQERVHQLIAYLGLSSDMAVSDILTIYQIMQEQATGYWPEDLQSELNIDAHEKKIILQRVRRALKRGLENLASRYLNEIDNEISLSYGNVLYGYYNIHREIQYLEKNSDKGGGISMKKFFEGFYLLVNQKDTPFF